MQIQFLLGMCVYIYIYTPNTCTHRHIHVHTCTRWSRVLRSSLLQNAARAALVVFAATAESAGTRRQDQLYKLTPQNLEDHVGLNLEIPVQVL